MPLSLFKAIFSNRCIRSSYAQIAIDKMTVVSIGKIGASIGRADDALMLKVSRALAVFLGIV